MKQKSKIIRYLKTQASGLKCFNTLSLLTIALLFQAGYSDYTFRLNVINMSGDDVFFSDYTQWRYENMTWNDVASNYNDEYLGNDPDFMSPKDYALESDAFWGTPYEWDLIDRALEPYVDNMEDYSAGTFGIPLKVTRDFAYIQMVYPPTAGYQWRIQYGCRQGESDYTKVDNEKNWPSSPVVGTGSSRVSAVNDYYFEYEYFVLIGDCAGQVYWGYNFYDVWNEYMGHDNADWSDWSSANTPTNGNEQELLADHIPDFVDGMVKDIQCRVKKPTRSYDFNYEDVWMGRTGIGEPQFVSCDTQTGLTCYKSDQPATVCDAYNNCESNKYKNCGDYEIRWVLDKEYIVTGWLNADQDLSNTDWEKLHIHFDNDAIDSNYYGIEPAYVEMRLVSTQQEVGKTGDAYTLNTRYGGKAWETTNNPIEGDYEFQAYFGWTPWLDVDETQYSLENNHKRWTDWYDDDIVTTTRGQMPNRTPDSFQCRNKDDHTQIATDYNDCIWNNVEIRYNFGFREICNSNYKDGYDNGVCDWSYVAFKNRRIMLGQYDSADFYLDAAGYSPKGIHAVEVNLHSDTTQANNGAERWTYDQTDGKIRAGWNENYCLDVAFSQDGVGHGDNIQLWKSCDVDDTWDFDPFDGRFKLRGSSYCLDIAESNGTYANGQNAQLRWCGQTEEAFAIENMSTYKILRRDNRDIALDLPGTNSSQNYLKLQQSDADAVTETWTYYPHSGRIHASWDKSMCVDVVGDDPGYKGPFIQIRSCNLITDSYWDIDKSVGDIRNQDHSNMCLQLRPDGKAEQYYCDNNNGNEKWFFYYD